MPLVMAMLPFGMFAALALGGLSLLLANLLAMMTIGILLVRRLSWRGRREPFHIPPAGLYLLAFALYSLFAGFVMVRIFQGQFLVFPMNVTYKSTQVSVFFPSTMWPLHPTKSNISQSFYILLSCGFFLAAVLVLRRRGPRFAETGLVWAGGLNILLGLLDLLGLDSLLGVIRTADYSLANEHTVAGMARVIGGFSEASVFGAASAAFAGYFLMSFLIGRRGRDGFLALGNMAFAALALSSTAFLALAVAVVLVVLHARTYLHGAISRTAGHVFVIGLAVLVSLLCVAVMLTPVLDLAADLLDRLFLSKRGTLSGMERSAWAGAGFNAFFQTWGFGAGPGSLRGSGLASVMLGSVGLPGTICFLGFLYYAVGKPIGEAGLEMRRIYYASRVSALTLLTSMMVSATVPDPTLLLMSVTALAVSARDASWISHQVNPRRAVREMAVEQT
ncbi:hypothetical protein [Ruegeria marina]|uniref:hypothetical protein n=1 Tax=Ruegeria marina TaxID=639004 RepID=UPI00115FCCA2|nr:hypothetical protein [Ruegeria marina]